MDEDSHLKREQFALKSEQLQYMEIKTILAQKLQLLTRSLTSWTCALTTKYSPNPSLKVNAHNFHTILFGIQQPIKEFKQKYQSTTQHILNDTKSVLTTLEKFSFTKSIVNFINEGLIDNFVSITQLMMQRQNYCANLIHKLNTQSQNQKATMFASYPTQSTICIHCQNYMERQRIHQLKRQIALGGHEIAQFYKKSIKQNQFEDDSDGDQPMLKYYNKKQKMRMRNTSIIQANQLVSSLVFEGHLSIQDMNINLNKLESNLQRRKYDILACLIQMGQYGNEIISSAQKTQSFINSLDSTKKSTDQSLKPFLQLQKFNFQKFTFDVGKHFSHNLMQIQKEIDKIKSKYGRNKGNQGFFQEKGINCNIGKNQYEIQTQKIKQKAEKRISLIQTKTQQHIRQHVSIKKQIQQYESLTKYYIGLKSQQERLQLQNLQLSQRIPKLIQKYQSKVRQQQAELKYFYQRIGKPNCLSIPSLSCSKEQQKQQSANVVQNQGNHPIQPHHNRESSIVSNQMSLKLHAKHRRNASYLVALQRVSTQKLNSQTSSILGNSIEEIQRAQPTSSSINSQQQQQYSKKNTIKQGQQLKLQIFSSVFQYKIQSLISQDLNTKMGKRISKKLRAITTLEESSGNDAVITSVKRNQTSSLHAHNKLSKARSLATKDQITNRIGGFKKADNKVQLEKQKKSSSLDNKNIKSIKNIKLPTKLPILSRNLKSSKNLNESQQSKLMDKSQTNKNSLLIKKRKINRKLSQQAYDSTNQNALKQNEKNKQPKQYIIDIIPDFQNNNQIVQENIQEIDHLFSAILQKKHKSNQNQYKTEFNQNEYEKGFAKVQKSSLNKQILRYSYGQQQSTKVQRSFQLQKSTLVQKTINKQTLSSRLPNLTKHQISLSTSIFSCLATLKYQKKSIYKKVNSQLIEGYKKNRNDNLKNYEQNNSILFDQEIDQHDKLPISLNNSINSKVPMSLNTSINTKDVSQITDNTYMTNKNNVWIKKIIHFLIIKHRNSCSYQTQGKNNICCTHLINFVDFLVQNANKQTI